MKQMKKKRYYVPLNISLLEINNLGGAICTSGGRTDYDPEEWGDDPTNAGRADYDQEEW